MRELFNPKFDRDFKKLKREHQLLFLDAQEQFVMEFEQLLIHKTLKSVS